MSTKIKDYSVKIKASVESSALVRSSDNEEKVIEYTKNAFTQSMESKGLDVVDIEVKILSES